MEIPILYLIQPNLKFEITTDASKTGLGGRLYQY